MFDDDVLEPLIFGLLIVSCFVVTYALNSAPVWLQ